MSAPRPYETDPFHPLGSILTIKQFLYICKSLPVISSMWYELVYVYTNCACALAEHSNLGSEQLLKLFCFSNGTCW